MSKMRKFKALLDPEGTIDVWLHRDHVLKIMGGSGSQGETIMPEYSCVVDVGEDQVYLVNTPPETVAKWVNGEFDGE